MTSNNPDLKNLFLFLKILNIFFVVLPLLQCQKASHNLDSKRFQIQTIYPQSKEIGVRDFLILYSKQALLRNFNDEYSDSLIRISPKHPIKVYQISPHHLLIQPLENFKYSTHYQVYFSEHLKSKNGQNLLNKKVSFKTLELDLDHIKPLGESYAIGQTIEVYFNQPVVFDELKAFLLLRSSEKKLSFDLSPKSDRAFVIQIKDDLKAGETLEVQILSRLKSQEGLSFLNHKIQKTYDIVSDQNDLKVSCISPCDLNPSLLIQSHYDISPDELLFYLDIKESFLDKGVIVKVKEGYLWNPYLIEKNQITLQLKKGLTDKKAYPLKQTEAIKLKLSKSNPFRYLIFEDSLLTHLDPFFLLKDEINLKFFPSIDRNRIKNQFESLQSFKRNHWDSYLYFNDLRERIYNKLKNSMTFPETSIDKRAQYRSFTRDYKIYDNSFSESSKRVILSPSVLSIIREEISKLYFYPYKNLNQKLILLSKVNLIEQKASLLGFSKSQIEKLEFNIISSVENDLKSLLNNSFLCRIPFKNKCLFDADYYLDMLDIVFFLDEKTQKIDLSFLKDRLMNDFKLNFSSLNPFQSFRYHLILSEDQDSKVENIKLFLESHSSYSFNDFIAEINQLDENLEAYSNFIPVLQNQIKEYISLLSPSSKDLESLSELLSLIIKLNPDDTLIDEGLEFLLKFSNNSELRSFDFYHSFIEMALTYDQNLEQKNLFKAMLQNQSKILIEGSFSFLSPHIEMRTLSAENLRGELIFRKEGEGILFYLLEWESDKSSKQGIFSNHDSIFIFQTIFDEGPYLYVLNEMLLMDEMKDLLLLDQNLRMSIEPIESSRKFVGLFDQSRQVQDLVLDESHGGIKYFSELDPGFYSYSYRIKKTDRDQLSFVKLFEIESPEKSARSLQLDSH